MTDAERYGPQIDSLYEEKWKNERLTLHVDGRLVRSEPNTPAGRQAIDKAALRYAETSEDVRVGPEGEVASVTVPGGKSEGQGAVIAASPSRPTLAPCCESVPFPAPSGRIRRRHAYGCPIHPGQPVGALTATVRDISEGRLARQHRMQTQHVGLDQDKAEHPAGGVLTPTDSWCPVHGAESVFDCVTCSDRRTS